jgi:hypothetical protein
MKSHWKLLLIATVVVVLLTLLLRRLVVPILFYALWPGNVLSLAITGGHGGTAFQDVFATIAGVFLNILAYFGVMLVLKKSFSR